MADKIKCIIVDDEAVARDVLKTHLEKIDRVEIMASCKNALEAFQAVNTLDVDLVFLDINMPEISGLSFAKSTSGDLKIIFTTAYRDYAVDGFDLKAVDYLLKPISFERLLQAVQKYLDENPSPDRVQKEEISAETTDSVFIRIDRKMVRVKFTDIVYIESISDYIKIHLKDQRVLVTRESLSNIEARLPQESFLRTHRSYIASLREIDSYTNDTIGLGKHEIPISRGYRDAVMNRLGG